MRNEFLYTILFSMLLFSCDCGIDEKELIFKESELDHFSSFTVGDTLIYTDQIGNTDRVVVKEISDHDKKPEVNCGIFRAQPNNHKAVYIEHLPVNIYPFSHWEVDSTAEIKDFHYLLSMNITPSPRDLDLHVSFKNFIFNRNDYENYRIEKDTIIGGFKVKSFYRFPHSYPERLKDSSYITEVFWTAKYGLIAYKNQKGNTYIKTNANKK
ncbi:MAG: hypothetical protein COA32_09470 [Fluviicola sp.]|nr:MAG: hypothetical protein COA32_09470 [Fluviicola sp.]